MSPNLTGAALMMGSMAAFTINDAMVKSVGATVPLFQLLTLRAILTTVMIFALARHLGALRLNLARRDWGLIAIRCASEVGATYFFLTALMNIPLANVTAVLQVLPLTVTLGAALFFGEAVGWRRALAIAVGFCGMLLIVRPGTEGFDIYSVYSLLAVVCVTARDLSTRRMSANVPSMLVTLSASVSILAFATIGSLGTRWVPLGANEAALIGGASLFVMGGYLLSVMVMRVGDISFVAPFRYTSLVWALVLGWLVFGDWPSNLTLVGAGLVVATGLFTLYRERALLRS